MSSPKAPRRARLFAGALFLPPLLFAFACHLDTNVGFDNTCVDDSDCPAGQICDPSGACVDPGCVPAPEVCDGVDNDCNGAVDEGCGQICSNGMVCPPGQVCAPDGTCIGACVPVPEVCDGVDNDCDNAIDEGCAQPCDPSDPANSCPPGEVCDPATGTCVSGCVPAPEVCDGVDNDCNGVIDEGCGQICMNGAICPPGQICAPDGTCIPGQPCDPNDPASCPPGELCDASTGVCVPGCVPSPEVCDGIDNDCNGQIDDGCWQPCDPNGSCPPGQVCGPDGLCHPGCVPSPEVCDGIDNDCNGQVDEGCGQPCDPNDPANSCAPGEICDPATGTCVPNCIPGGVELCDGVDNNCNGAVDEGCGMMCTSDADCPPGQLCDLAIGACVPACVPGDPNCP